MRIQEIHSQIDTDRFGFKIGKTDGELFRVQPKKVIETLKAQGYKLIIARVSMNDIALINAMEDHGFRIKDSQLTFRFDLNKNSALQSLQMESSFEIRKFKVSDADALAELAKNSFDNYGHYFADSKLDKEKCRAIYADWTYNSCTDSDVADQIFVSSYNNNPNGFLSFKLFEKDNKRYAAGGIGAVDSKFRGKNIFPALVLAGLEWGLEIGLDWEEHNTLVNNTAVNRSFSKMGFHAGNHVITMHCWLS